jgi:hypothetical protein
VEEQFYLLWPLLLLGVFVAGRRLGWRSPAVTATVVAVAGAARLGGRISYSWYLWDWPLLILVPAMVGHALGLLPNLALAAASGLLALATVKLVEDPVRFSTRLRTRPGRSLAVGAALTMVAVVASVGTAVALPNPNGHGQAAAPEAIRVTAPPGAQPAVQDPAEAQLQSLSPPIVQAVAKAVNVRTVPANLTPSVGHAHADQPQPVQDGCLVR